MPLILAATSHRHFERSGPTPFSFTFAPANVSARAERNLSSLFSLAVQCLFFLGISKATGMTQVELAKILGVQQPQISLLMRNRAGNFSVGRLMEFLTALRHDVELTVRPSRKQRGALSVVSA